MSATMDDVLGLVNALRRDDSEHLAKLKEQRREIRRFITRDGVEFADIEGALREKLDAELQRALTMWVSGHDDPGTGGDLPRLEGLVKQNEAYDDIYSQWSPWMSASPEELREHLPAGTGARWSGGLVHFFHDTLRGAWPEISGELDDQQVRHEAFATFFATIRNLVTLSAGPGETVDMIVTAAEAEPLVFELPPERLPVEEFIVRLEDHCGLGATTAKLLSYALAFSLPRFYPELDGFYVELVGDGNSFSVSHEERLDPAIVRV